MTEEPNYILKMEEDARQLVEAVVALKNEVGNYQEAKDGLSTATEAIKDYINETHKLTQEIYKQTTTLNEIGAAQINKSLKELRTSVEEVQVKSELLKKAFFEATDTLTNEQQQNIDLLAKKQQKRILVNTLIFGGMFIIILAIQATLLFKSFTAPTMVEKSEPESIKFFSLYQTEKKLTLGPFRLYKGEIVYIGTNALRINIVEDRYELISASGNKYGPYKFNNNEEIEIGSLKFIVQR